MKKIIGIAAVIAILAGGIFGFTIWRARKEASEAVRAYNEAAGAYNENIAPYNEAAAGIAAADSQLREVLEAAAEVIEQGEEAYEPETLEELRAEVEKAERALVEVPVQIDPFGEMEETYSFDRTDLESVKLEAEAAASAVQEVAAKIPPQPKVPDYTEQIEAVQKARTAYENSVRKLENVTAPADAFVRERLKGLEHVVQTAAVTESNDPNELLGKEGGYLGCVYFLDDRIEPELLPEEVYEDAEPAGEEEGGGQQISGETEDEEAADSGDAGSTAADDSTEGSKSAADSGETAAVAGDTGSAVVVSDDGNTGSAASAVGRSEDENPAAAASGRTEEPAEAGTTGGTAAASSEAVLEEQEKYDVIAAGTAGGGAVEIFATVEEAEKRDEYLAYFAGSVMDPGAHAVEGTCVIRASRYLEADQQEALIETVRAALLKVE